MNRAGSASQCLHHGATVCQPDAAWVPTQNACTRAVWLPGRAIRTVLVAALLVGAFALHASAAVQHDLPHPPCGATAPFPAYPPDATAGVAPANVRAWRTETGSPHWAPPPCTGWASDGFRTLVALAGRIQLAQDDAVEQVLSRLGAVSMLRGARYWSVSDGAWRPLVSDASALDGPDPQHRRSDFSAAELRTGRNFYFVQHDSRTSGDVVYRLRVRESGPDHLVVQTENVTRIRLMVVTLFQPGALQTVHFLQQLSPTSWGYYSLSRTTEEGSSSLADGHAASYVNRAAAFYRLLAGVPTDRDPPLAR